MPDSQFKFNYNIESMRNYNLSIVSEDKNRPGTLLIPFDYELS